MDILKLRIPLEFVESHLGRPSWQEVLFGLEQQLLAPEAPSQLAVEELERAEGSPALIELAAGEPGNNTEGHVARLAEAERPEPPDHVSRKWLYLTLAWLYEQRTNFDDPLEMVEMVYADFGYPERVAHFVRYMPSRDERQLGTVEQNRDRLISKWKQFLVGERAALTSAN
jgi:hypothetical protein